MKSPQQFFTTVSEQIQKNDGGFLTSVKKAMGVGQTEALPLTSAYELQVDAVSLITLANDK
jgi:hypothetical protein